MIKVTSKSANRTVEKLDTLYAQYNRRKYVHPDPLEFLYSYPDIRDREITGLVASSLAFGKVTQILEKVAEVLDLMTESPHAFLQQATRKSLNKAFGAFQYRFVKGEQMIFLLWGIKKTIEQYGSLHQCFLAGIKKDDETLLPAQSFFAGQLVSHKNNTGYLLALPEKGSACKRMNLFLRWMVRKDNVDPGGWTGVDVSKLIVPLDTHMYKCGQAFGFTSRKQPNMKTALDITAGFKKLVPEDPVKYDFTLTRYGIRDELCIDDMVEQLICAGKK